MKTEYIILIFLILLCVVAVIIHTQPAQHQNNNTQTTHYTLAHYNKTQYDAALRASSDKSRYAKRYLRRGVKT